MSHSLQCLKKIKQNPNEPKISPVKLRQKENQLSVISKSSKIKGIQDKGDTELLIHLLFPNLSVSSAFELDRSISINSVFILD